MRSNCLPNVCTLGLLLLAGCGGGASSGPATQGFSNLDILLTDAPAHELLAFEAGVSELHLVLQGGGESANLLAAPVRFELLGLQGSAAWLASQDLPAGSYGGVHLVFEAGSYAARKNDGSEVAVSSTSDDLVLAFSAPLVVDDSSYRRVTIDVDLANALSGALDTPPLLFAPQGFVSDDSGHVESPIDELKGIVQSFDAAQGSLVLSAFVDDDAQVGLGDVQVGVGAGTLLVQDGGEPFAGSAAFFAALAAGSTVLEVHGSLASGAVQATRIEVDDNAGGGGSANLVRLEGLVLALGPGSQFEISISQVPQGSGIVAAAFGGSIPATLEITHDASTHFYLHEHTSTDSSALALGQKVDVKFSSFANPPYLAARVEIDDESGENEGTLVDPSGLPASLVLHLDESSAAILAGQVDSTSTPVDVALAGASITLDTQTHPSLSSAALLAGLRLRVHGQLSGPSNGPTIAASEVEVRPGKLVDALLGSVGGGADPSFTTSAGSIDDPFGDGVSEGPLTIRVGTGCVFHGAATSLSEFLALASDPPGGAGVRVRVRGIGTGTAQEIRAYEIDSDLDP